MFTKEQLAKWRSMGFEFDDFYNQVAVEKEKSLSIKYTSENISSDSLKLYFSISSKEMTGKKATLSIIGIENSTGNFFPTNFGSRVIKISSDNFNYELKFDISSFPISNFSFNNIDFSKITFKAIISCDGIVKETGHFTIRKTKSTPASQVKKCFCRSLELLDVDLIYIVTQLRKLDTRPVLRVPKDKNGNKTWLDKHGNEIPSTDRGRRPESAVKLNEKTYNLSAYEDMDSQSREVKDRIFYLKSDGNNVIASEANYSEFTKCLNKMFVKYQINSCLRKLNFFAQIYVETQKLATTYEASPNSSVSGGNFYRGRGIKQITHDFNYLDYYSYRFDNNLYTLYYNNREKRPVKDPQETVAEFNARTENKFISIEDMEKFKLFVPKVSTDLYTACDSAGWYWNREKINQYADKDEVRNVSAAVNNPSAINEPSRGIADYADRKKFHDIMKIIFDYENC